MCTSADNGYKNTKLGIVPDSWKTYKLSNVLKLFIEPLDMDDDKEYELITVRRSGKIDSRGIYQGKNILVKTQFYIRENNFVISKRQVSHGAFGLVPANLDGAIVSNEYNVFKTDETKINTKFLRYYARHPKFWQSFYSYSDGIHIEKLLFKTTSWLKQRFPFPTLKEQEIITQILSTWDEAIVKQEELIKEKEQLKKGLMQKLLSGEVRFDGFTDEWKFVKLGDLLAYEQPTKYLVSNTNYSDDYEIPVLTAGKTFILGYTNETEGIYKDNLPVIIFDDFTTATQFVDFPFKAKSSAMKILKPRNSSIDIKLIYELVQMINFVADDHKRYWISEYQELEIKLPSKEEQQKIADTLRFTTKEIDLLKNELEELKQQKKGLMQKLLTGEVRVKV